MSIKASPRSFSKNRALDSFVLCPKSKPARRGLVEMTNNVRNSLNAVRSETSSQPFDMNEFVDFSRYEEDSRVRSSGMTLMDFDIHDENTLVHLPYVENFQDASQTVHHDSAPTWSYATCNVAQYQQPKTSSSSLSVYQNPALTMKPTAMHKPGPTRDVSYYGIDIFANVSRATMANGDPSFQTTKSEANRASFASGWPSSSSSTYPESFSGDGDSTKSSRTSSSTVHSHRVKWSLCGQTMFPHCGYTPPHSDRCSAQQIWSPENTFNTYNLPMTNRGLPTMATSSQHSHNLSAIDQVGRSTSQPLSSGNIYPEDMQFNISSSAMPAADMDCKTEKSLEPSGRFNNAYDNGVVEFLASCKHPNSASSAAQRVRRRLPHAAEKSIQCSIVPQCNFSTSDRSRKTRFLMIKPEPDAQTRTTSLLANAEVISGNRRPTTASTPQKSTPAKQNEQKCSRDADCDWQASTPVKATAKDIHFRDPKDEFLVKHKLAGMSYKDIRRLGKFTEAESTLRGRFRTLTKHKADRVRKPEWTETDVRLLKKAVRKLTTISGRIPWKQVAEYIANHGGSYQFGNATCCKKWDELLGGNKLLWSLEK